MKICVMSLAFCFAMLTLPGCTNTNESRPVDVVTVSPEDQIKSALQSVVDTQSVGSEMITIEENIGKLSGDKSASLQKDLEELKGLDGAAAATKAKAMIGKL